MSKNIEPKKTRNKINPRHDLIFEKCRKIKDNLTIRKVKIPVLLHLDILGLPRF